MKKKLKGVKGKRTGTKKAKKTKPKSKAKAKKRHKYQKQKYPALNVAYQVANRRELLDVDYIHKLSDKEKKWLDSFLQETVITNFDHDGKILIKDQETRRELYRDNNRRNNDVMSKLKTEGRLYYAGVPSSGDEKSVSVFDNAEEQATVDEIENAFLTAITIKKHIKIP